ncbi:ROK family protein [Streptacidiphilus sp. NEAU-YB345]|uniref:ROK family protein n=1 Tax=Streptacidiphilus fuscans TaxID=2789292 RepID=A0A931BD77_9ACTN|nr:ROK family protein [Streptacidiphilus fuscans]
MLALEIAGDRIEAGVLGEDGSWRHRESRPSDSALGSDAVIDALVDCATELTRRYAPVAAGVAVPGIVDERTGLAVFSAHLHWRNLPLPSWLADELGIPVAFGHDVRAAALAEAQFGAGQGSRSLLLLSLGAGVASAAVLDGRVLIGGQGRAGELGHLVVRPDGPSCPCGGRGCVEALASTTALFGRYRATSGTTAEAAADAAGVVDAAEVVRRAHDGDPVAAAVWREAVEALAEALRAAVVVLDPKRVVLGGHFAEALRRAQVLPQVCADLSAALAERLTVQTPPALVPTTLHGQAGCLGAALLARRG